MSKSILQRRSCNKIRWDHCGCYAAFLCPWVWIVVFASKSDLNKQNTFRIFAHHTGQFVVIKINQTRKHPNNSPMLFGEQQRRRKHIFANKTQVNYGLRNFNIGLGNVEWVHRVCLRIIRECVVTTCSCHKVNFPWHKWNFVFPQTILHGVFINFWLTQYFCWHKSVLIIMIGGLQLMKIVKLYNHIAKRPWVPFLT